MVTMVLAAAVLSLAVIRRRRRGEVWHTLPDSP
jgi:uncharacterized protein (TIGR03382 family)